MSGVLWAEIFNAPTAGKATQSESKTAARRHHMMEDPCKQDWFQPSYTKGPSSSVLFPGATFEIVDLDEEIYVQ
jgi:hypothetical protein